jgi:predicted esterase
MLNLNNTVDPHKGDDIIYAGAEINEAKHALILVHGRGAAAQSIIPLADELILKDTIVIAPQASQFTWYPYRFIEKRERNEPGISSGLKLIQSIIDSLIENNITPENIFILGFSQGACLTLDFAARNPKKYAGIFILSGGLIGEELDENEYQGNLERTPVFLGCSNNDFHIPESRVHESGEILKKMNAEVTKRIFPDMGHRISMEEIKIVNDILERHNFNQVDALKDLHSKN